MARNSSNLFALGLDGWLLGMEAARVIWLRSWLIALGGTAGEREARRMVEEKFDAHSAFCWTLLTAGTAWTPETATRRAVRHYGRRVRANGRRLTRVPFKS